MTVAYSSIDELLDAVVSNQVGVASLSNELLEDLLYKIYEVIADKQTDVDGDSEKIASVLEKLEKVLMFRVQTPDADDFSDSLLASTDRGNFSPPENNFTLQ